MDLKLYETGFSKIRTLINVNYEETQTRNQHAKENTTTKKLWEAVALYREHELMH